MIECILNCIPHKLFQLCDQYTRAAEAIFDRSGHKQICHHCLCGASTHIVCKAHVHVKHQTLRGSGGMPPRKFLKIIPSKIESDCIFSDLIAIMFMSVYSYT